MFAQENPRIPASLALAIILSLALHGLFLLLSLQAPESQAQAAGRLQASFKPRPEITKIVQPSAPSPAQHRPAKSPQRKKVLAVAKPAAQSASRPSPQWSVAEKEEMNNFLQELEGQGKPTPNLARRSMAMAREYGRQQASEDAAGEGMLERLPNSPPVNPFSLEMYLDALVKKLNRSAAFVKNDPRSKGVKSGLVQVRLNPDGTLRSFKILNAADQQAEISFIQAVVEQAVPFSAFPADIRRSSRSLTMMICIRPPSLSGGIGFTRTPEGGRC